MYWYVIVAYAVELWKFSKGIFAKLFSIKRRIPEEHSSVLSWRTVANALESEKLDDDALVDLCKQYLEQGLSGEGSHALGISSASIGFQVESSMPGNWRPKRAPNRQRRGRGHCRRRTDQRWRRRRLGTSTSSATWR